MTATQNLTPHQPDARGAAVRIPASAAKDPSIVLPVLPHDAIERAAAVEALAVEIVRQVGSVVALTIASALDEAVADAQR